MYFPYSNHIQGIYKELTPCALTCDVYMLFMQLEFQTLEAIALLQVILAILKQQRQENSL